MAGQKRQNAEMRKPEILEGYYRVLIEEGIEGASISKIARHLDIHPSLILHYFGNKENLKLALIELMISKFKATHMINFDHIENEEERFVVLFDLLFSYEWSRTVDPGVHFGFYYLSYRHDHVADLFRGMFRWLRDYLYDQFVLFNKSGVINVKDELKAADFVVTLMEGMEFHAQFLRQRSPFDEFAGSAKAVAISALKNGSL